MVRLGSALFLAVSIPALSAGPVLAQVDKPPADREGKTGISEAARKQISRFEYALAIEVGACSSSTCTIAPGDDAWGSIAWDGSGYKSAYVEKTTHPGGELPADGSFIATCKVIAGMVSPDTSTAQIVSVVEKLRDDALKHFTRGVRDGIAEQRVAKARVRITLRTGGDRCEVERSAP
jgi:hypothetical protein